jgi:3-deoxy-D-manno-octulosonate 8-phosphate phosphatase (KDO 8-P phosphatase)
VLEVISKKRGVKAEHIAFVGDDLIDIPLMKKVGLSVAVADAHETVLEHADMVTAAQGGAGAVREVCEAILKAQGLWEKVLARFR